MLPILPAWQANFILWVTRWCCLAFTMRQFKMYCQSLQSNIRMPRLPVMTLCQATKHDNETCGFFISERMGVYFQPNTSKLVTLEGAPGRLGVHTTSCFYLLDEFPGRQNHLRLSGHCNSSADAAMQTAPRDCRFCLNSTHAEYPQIETLLINNRNYFCRNGG